MDYGAHIKKTEKNFSRQSKTHVRQSTFKGSNRENRSRILELIFLNPHTHKEIIIALNDKRTNKNIQALFKEGFIDLINKQYVLKK